MLPTVGNEKRDEVKVMLVNYGTVVIKGLPRHAPHKIYRNFRFQIKWQFERSCKYDTGATPLHGAHRTAAHREVRGKSEGHVMCYRSVTAVRVAVIV